MECYQGLSPLTRSSRLLELNHVNARNMDTSHFQNFVPSRPGSAELEHGTAKFRGTRNNYADPCPWWLNVENRGQGELKRF